MRAAEAYGAAFSKLTVQAIDPMLSSVAFSPGARLFDVVCGLGDLAAVAARRGARVTGLAFSPRMVALALRIHPGIDFREGDAEAMPFGAGSFEVVAMNFGVGHVPDPDRAFREAHRVLASGGRYAFSWWAGLDEAVVFG